MFGLGATELFIILAIALVIFGGKKLKNLGGDLGGAISEFKTSLHSDGDDDDLPDDPSSGGANEETASVAASNESEESDKG